MNSKQLSSPKDVYFLGAGVSALAGVPTFSNFYETAEDICKKKSMNSESNEQFERILKYWKKNFNKCNVEEFYSAVEMQEMLISNPIDKEKREIITTDELENFIYSTIQKSRKSGIVLIDSVYELFLKNITTDSVIITTNWDSVLETSSEQFSIEKGWINYECALPYEKGVERHSRSLFDFDGDTPLPTYHILKLHGSLNWRFCDECRKIYYFDEKSHDRLASSEVVECNNDNSGGKLTRIIVPPKLSKLIKPEQNNSKVNTDTSLKSLYFQLRAIWSKASECLKMCEKLYFIGYSFPETDVQMKTFISNALRENSNLNKVIIVSSQKHGNSRVKFEERYLSILSRINQSKIKFYYGGFEEFCKRHAESRNPHLLINSEF